MTQPAQIRAFVKKYKCSAAWMAEQMGVSDRQIQRINAGTGSSLNEATWQAFLKLENRVKKGELPPTRQQRSDQAVARRKGQSGYWGVGMAPMLGKWQAYFSHNKVQRRTSGCVSKKEAIERAEKMAEALGVSSPKIGTCQVKSLTKPWRAFYHKKIRGRYRHVQIGHFATVEEAARAHDEAARAIGNTKRLNFP
jgi:hypothetical protein